MKKVKQSDELRPEYNIDDLGKGVRGKYLNLYRKETNLILLSPDVAEVFSSEKDVNEALRSLINIAEKRVRLTKRSTRRKV